MFRNIPLAAVLAASALASVLAFVTSLDGRSEERLRPAPEFPKAGASSWINTKPLTMKSLRGRPVVLEVWTFG